MNLSGAYLAFSLGEEESGHSVRSMHNKIGGFD